MNDDKQIENVYIKEEELIMKIYRIYKEETELILNDTYDEDGYREDRFDSYETTQTTIKYVDSYEKLEQFIDNCDIREDVYYEEIEVE